jgi:hypothetical protein
MKKKRNLETATPEDLARRREEHARTRRMLADRIAHHQARLAERARGRGEQASGG